MSKNIYDTEPWWFLIAGAGEIDKDALLSTRLRMWQLGAVVIYAVQAIHLYRARGFKTSMENMASTSSRNKNDINQKLFERNVITLCRIILRIYRESNCLAEAITICNVMRRFHLNAQVVLGRRLFFAGSRSEERDYDFHAWVEIDDLPITEIPQVKMCHVEVYRGPQIK